MFNSKVNHMTVIVKGVRDDDYEGRELMMEVVRRNCKMERRSARTSMSNLRHSAWAGSSVILSC